MVIQPPIDPHQLLKALAPLLATSGGMKSAEEVVRLSSLMKKFSRKLVSRCVYVNVLRVTAPDVLEAFLDQGGWETINNWLQDAKKTENYAFLVDLLRLFKTLPMTVGRLKQNNSAKVVKALTKSESDDVKTLAADLVETWMKLVKGNTSNSHEEKVVKKKRKREHKEYHKKEHEKDKKEPKESDEKDKREHRDSAEKKSTPEKKNNSVENNVKRVEKGSTKNSKVVYELEDVKLPEYLEKELSIKKPKKDRPKTVKTFHAKFRSTGLEEPPPLPKAVSKKAVGVDKAAALAAKHAVKRIGGSVPRDTLPFEKKLKPTSTLMVAESNEGTEKLGIKLIPAKPKPIHVIKESAGFMDALVAEPSAPTRKKRKSSRTPTTPPSPTLTTPKLQFYKDTLETQGEGEKPDEKEAAESDAVTSENTEAVKENAADNGTESSTEIPDSEIETGSGKTLATEKVATPVVAAKNKAKRKKVSWADEPKLKQIYYFEMDETERVNVNNEKNFGDMKTLERKKERQVVESARRLLMGDKMEERATWVTPFLIDMPPPLVDRGCNSTQRDIQRSREQSILQEIYFSKESIPDSPHEPDMEMMIDVQEPKVIPLEDENNPDSVVDYSSMAPPAPVTSLPPALSSLMHSLNHKQVPNGPFPGEVDMQQYPEEAPPEPFYKTGPPPGFPPGLLGCAPPGFEPFGKFPPGPDNMMPPGPPGPMGPPPQGDMGLGPAPGPPNVMMQPPPPEEMEYYDPMRPPMHHPPMGPRIRMNGPPRNHGSNRHRGLGPMRGPMRRGGPPLRSRGRIICRNFMATNSCRFENSCIFLHPGVNGPMC